jgi:hypothetical protein
MFTYWNNTTDLPHIQARLNTFFFINIRVFKVKLGNYINVAISGLNTLKYKQIKIFYELLSFEYLYTKFALFILLITTMLLFM